MMMLRLMLMMCIHPLPAALLTQVVIGADNWYMVEYEGHIFPGEVVAIGVSVMEPARNCWKWPVPKDSIFYMKVKMI